MSLKKAAPVKRSGSFFLGVYNNIRVSSNGGKMPAAKYDLSIEQGVSSSLIMTYKDADGNVVDLTNWCGRITLKTNNSEIIVYNTGHNGSDYKFTIDGPNGKLTLLLPAPTTNNFTFNTAKYDFELLRPDDFYAGGDNVAQRVLFGTITISKRFSQYTGALECTP